MFTATDSYYLTFLVKDCNLKLTDEKSLIIGTNFTLIKIIQ